MTSGRGISFADNIQEVVVYEEELVDRRISLLGCGYRYWSAEMETMLPKTILEVGRFKFGAQVVAVGQVVRILQVTPKDGPSVTEGKNAIALWNSRCEKTFPEDEIRAGDYIVKVNDISEDPFSMIFELVRFTKHQIDDVFLVLCRDESHIWKTTS